MARIHMNIGWTRFWRQAAAAFAVLCMACFFTPAHAQETSQETGNGPRGVVSSATPEASEAGAAILKRGGNAVDAAIAVSLALGVSEPAGSGIGGQTVFLIAAPGQAPKVIHGTTLSPKSTPVGAERKLLRSGYTATTVPSNLKVLDRAFLDYRSGQVAWRDLVQPAIDIAENGFPLGGFRARAGTSYAGALREYPAGADLMLSAGQPYREGEILRQPVLAKTLRRIAAEGAEDFYSGKIAEEIAADMKAHGGWLTLEDLTSFPNPPIVEPLHGHYRGQDIYTLPPPFGGWVVLRALGTYEKSVPDSSETDAPNKTLAMLTALHEAHSERRDNPVPDWQDAAGAVKARVPEWTDRGGETTHFSVIDAEGMMVAATQSIDSYFGSKTASPKLGFLYNNYMNSFADTGPYAVGPSKAPLSSMSATILTENGTPVLALGSPGSARIISAVVQVTDNWLTNGRDIDAAVRAPRLHATPGMTAYVESRKIDNISLAQIAVAGFSLGRPAYGVATGSLDPYFGGVHAVAIQSGQAVGASDPRRDGQVSYVGRISDD